MPGNDAARDGAEDRVQETTPSFAELKAQLLDAQVRLAAAELARVKLDIQLGEAQVELASARGATEQLKTSETSQAELKTQFGRIQEALARATKEKDAEGAAKILAERDLADLQAKYGELLETNRAYSVALIALKALLAKLGFPAAAE